MQFVKADLSFERYSWDDNSISPYMGTPSRRLFNRYNGNQVLFLINAFASENPDFSVKDAHQMEEFILQQLPLEAKSEVSVLNWMKEMKGSTFQNMS